MEKKSRFRTVVCNGIAYPWVTAFVREMLPQVNYAAAISRVHKISQSRIGGDLVITEEDLVLLRRKTLTSAQSGRMGRLAAERAGGKRRIWSIRK